MKNKFLSLIVLIIIFSSIFIASDSTNKNYNPSNTHFQFISSLSLPAELSWCGESIPMDDPEIRERAEREFFLLLQQPGQIMLYIKRSGRYFPLFERVSRELNLPEDLKYLSVAESALYMSTSRVGAVGLWQFMPATARMMDLHVSDFVDERRDPEKSTYAGMKYMKENYDRFGSWYLAAASYNMGWGRVKNSLNFQHGEDYFDLFLNSETSRYIFRIVAIKEIMENAEKYGFEVPQNELYSEYPSKTIIVNSSIEDLGDWAKENGTNYKMVRRLNPWILKSRLRPPLTGKSYNIKVPA